MKTIIYSIIAIMMASMVYSAIPAFLQQDKKSDAESFGFYETFNRTEIIGKLDKNDSLFSLVTIPIEGEQKKRVYRMPFWDIAMEIRKKLLTTIFHPPIKASPLILF